MQSIARFFVDNHKFTLVLSLGLILFGVLGLIRINSEAFPSVDIGSAIIATRYNGATASDIETKITKPLEDEIRTVRGIKRVTSVSQAGFSRIVTEVDIDNYKVKEVISDLQRAVDRANGLPTDLEARPIFAEIKSDEFPILELAVVGTNVGRLRDKIADDLKEELQDNKRVSNVGVIGYTERQFNIYLDKDKLSQQHVAIHEVMTALASRNVTIPGGELKSSAEQKLLRIEGKSRTVAELESIVVRANYSGAGVRIKDIARVEDTAEEAVALSRYNGQAATLLSITKKGGTDLVTLSQDVAAIVEQFRGKYGEKLQFHIYNNEGDRVSKRISILTSNAFIGLGLVIFFLLLFLPGWVGVMTALSLPIALLATLGLMPVMGYSLNTITILGLIIAVGMLVDNSIVVSENFVRLREEGMPTQEAIENTMTELWVPITASLLTTIAAFLPMLVTSGVLGQFIKAMPIVVSLALGVSLLESFFLLPMRLAMIGDRIVKNTGPQASKGDWFNRFVIPPFAALMSWVVRLRYLTVLIFMGIIAGSFVLMTQFNKFILFPAEQTEVYITRIEMPSGTPLEVTDEVSRELVQSIQDKLGPKIAHIVTRSGSAETDPTDPKGRTGANVALLMIFVNETTKNTVATQDFLTDLRALSHPKIKMLSFEALANGPPIGDPINATLRSNDDAQLSEMATRLNQKLAAIPGIFDARINDVFGDEEILIRLNHEKVGRLGLSLQDIGNTVRVAVAGQFIGDVNLANKEVGYFVRLDGDERRKISQLNQIQVADRMGNLIPLSQLATFEQRAGEAHVKRYDFRRSKTLTANLNDEIITSVHANALIEKEYLAIQKDFPDVSLSFGGEAENTKESFASLVQALVLSIVGIFALLVLIFRSFMSPFIILSTIPLGLVGMAAAFYLHQRPVSFLAVIGIIGLGGIIVNSGIVLISFIEQLKERSELSRQEILVQASVLRLRAVVVTALTTVSGLFPTAYGIGGSDEFIIPICLALAWGLTSGTILTIIWIPSAYGIVDDISEFWKRRGRA